MFLGAFCFFSVWRDCSATAGRIFTSLHQQTSLWCYFVNVFVVPHENRPARQRCSKRPFLERKFRLRRLQAAAARKRGGILGKLKQETSGPARRIGLSRQTRGWQLQLLQQPRPLFKGNIKHFRRSLHASIYSTQGIENDVSARLPNYNFGLLWPWSLTSWPPRSAIHVLAPAEDLCQFALKSVRFRSVTSRRL